MDLTERLEVVRQDYVDRLALALHEVTHTPGVHAVTEPVVRDEQGQPLRAGHFHLPTRHDATLRHEGAARAEAIHITSPPVPVPFAPVRFESPGGLHVALGPFRWDALRVFLADGSAALEWEPLLAWYEEWFKISEDGTGDLLLVVHSITDPVDSPEGTTFTLDLGSASIHALEELLDALAGLDVARVELGEVPDDQERS